MRLFMPWTMNPSQRSSPAVQVEGRTSVGWSTQTSDRRRHRHVIYWVQVCGSCLLVLISVNSSFSGWMLEVVKTTAAPWSNEWVWRTRRGMGVAGCGSKTKSCRRSLTEAGASACISRGPHCWSRASRSETQLDVHSSFWTMTADVTPLYVFLYRVEGRTWYTSHRGRLWIAAAAKKPTPQEIAEVEEMYRRLSKKGGCTVWNWLISCVKPLYLTNKLSKNVFSATADSKYYSIVLWKY